MGKFTLMYLVTVTQIKVYADKYVTHLHALEKLFDRFLFSIEENFGEL